MIARSDSIPTNDDVIKWKHFLRYWPFARGIHGSLVNSPHKNQWRRALMFSLICVWINAWVNNSEASDLIHHRAHYDVIVMSTKRLWSPKKACSLQWRHDERYGVSNHLHLDRLLNRLFRQRSKKTSKHRVTGLLMGILRWPMDCPQEGPVTRKMFPFDAVIMWIIWPHDLYTCISTKRFWIISLVWLQIYWCPV